MTESKGSFNTKKCAQYVDDEWQKTILQALINYIGVPNLSPQFDKTFYENDLTERRTPAGGLHSRAVSGARVAGALDIMVKWVQGLKVPGLTLEVLRGKDRTPLIFIQIEGEGS